MTTATKRLLVGRKIANFNHGKVPNGRDGSAHIPVIVLDNGATLEFVTEETDLGFYGVRILYFPKGGPNS
jgi:hypothetical protein